MELQQNDLVYILQANLTKQLNIECHMIKSDAIQVQSKAKNVNSSAFIQNFFKGRLDINKGDNSKLTKF